MTTEINASGCDIEYNDYRDTLSLPDKSLFTTDANLWEVYLLSFKDGPVRQYHNCHTCKRFITTAGCLVTIGEDGRLTSAAWVPENAPRELATAIANMKAVVERSRVTGVFKSSDATLGTPVTKEWTHYSVENPCPHRGGALNASQKAAEKLEDYRTVSRYIAGVSEDHLRQASTLLKGDALYRSEKVAGPINWLLDLKVKLSSVRHRTGKEAIVWRAIADAPAGYCHPASSMAGTLISDLTNGMSFGDAAKRFKSKMHPLKYQRPVAAPKAGTIDNAEKLVKSLGVERSFERRFASLSDIECLWTPLSEKPTEGVFGVLRSKKSPMNSVDAGNMTWVKFARDILPAAEKLKVLLSPGRQKYVTFTTAVNEDAPVLFQWDSPVAWYYWHGGCLASQFGLKPGWNDVDGVCLLPHAWGGRSLPNFQNEMAFLIHGAKETRKNSASIFPETLKSDFHGIRSVVEAYSNSTTIANISRTVRDSHAVGLGVGSKVMVDNALCYTIDRWE
jgi:hypothetical protein